MHSLPPAVATTRDQFATQHSWKCNTEEGTNRSQMREEVVAMKLHEVKEIARKQGLKTGNLRKGELIKAIQTCEGNIPCFGTGKVTECGQSTCCWREDCH